MRVLVLCDDFWHPAAIPRAGLAPLASAGFEFDFIEDASDWSEQRMATYPAVILTKSNNMSAINPEPWVDDAVQEAFRGYVHAGHGLLVIHSGAAGYAESAILRELMGGVFIQHPPQCEVRWRPIVGHTLTGSSAAFALRDEHYFMALDDTQADVFMTSTSEHGTQPAGWSRVAGEGRVCMLTPGHNLEVWLHPAYQTLLGNALRWCCKVT